MYQAYRYLPVRKDSTSEYHLHSKLRISFSILYSANLLFFLTDFPKQMSHYQITNLKLPNTTAKHIGILCSVVVKYDVVDVKYNAV